MGQGYGVQPQRENAAATSAGQVQFGDYVAVVRSDSMRKLLAMAERVARHSAAVLIVGETGSGKEMIARAIHHYSLRCTQPFVDVNCAALPEHLAESELFGHEKGAFSSADSQKPGLFELANRGTLFLDEIAELDAKIQVKLLRVLDGVAYYRLGGSRKVAVDVRIVAASNQDLEAAVHAGKFRSDLFHRLNQFQLRVPPLRERPDDVRAIAEYLLEQQLPGARFSAQALDLLETCSWKGNVRELRNALLQALLHVDGHRAQIEAADLRSWLPRPHAKPSPSKDFQGNLGEMERQMIQDTLQRTGGDRNETAKVLGISRRTLTRKLQQYEKEHDSPSRLGTFDHDQQRYFRVAVRIPAMLSTADGKEHSAEIVNVSIGGVALICDPPLEQGATVSVNFHLGGDVRINAEAMSVWTAGKRAGLRFLNVGGTERHALGQWLVQKARAEGWDVGAEATAQR